MKDLENFDVQEMSSKELKNVNGGGLLGILIVAALGAIMHHLWKK